jgi:Domain of Unknown Function (DUF930)
MPRTGGHDILWPRCGDIDIPIVYNRLSGESILSITSSLHLAVPVLLATALVGAHASSMRVEHALDRLEPITRMMQVCDIKAGETLRRESAYKAVDRVMIDAMATPEIEGAVIEGAGGAFRRNGQWFRLEFRCTLSSDQRSAASFDFTVGDEIPEAQWEEHGLWK